MVDHRLLPQLADQGDLLLLPLAAAAMFGAEDVIVDHNMVVAQVLRRLGKRLDCPLSPPSSICG
jgi:hypothetical protein